MPSADATDVLAALLRGERVTGAGRASFDACLDEQLAGLVHERLSRDPACCDWPTELREEIARRARVAVAIEIARQQELGRALHALAARGVQPILFKGTALAYALYASPSARPRSDTDLMIRREDVDAVSTALADLHYARPPHSGGELLFRQFWMERRDQYGIHHAFDVHWKISTQPVFAELLSYDELRAEAVTVPALGDHARAAAPIHALLLACTHAAMHHRNVERLLWIYDIDLLVRALPPGGLARLADLATAKQVGAVVASSLARAAHRLGTPVPAEWLDRLAASGDSDASANYLRPDRRWTHDLVASLQSLPGWPDRLRFIREVAFPAPRYILHAYGLSARAAPLLPLLYGHRILRGALNMMAGRK